MIKNYNDDGDDNNYTVPFARFFVWTCIVNGNTLATAQRFLRCLHTLLPAAQNILYGNQFRRILQTTAQ